MIITTKRSTSRYLLDIMFTALGWGVFLAFFVAGMFNILKGAARGPDVPLLPQDLVDSLGTLATYGLLMSTFAIVLIVCFKYNEYYGKYSKYGRYYRSAVAPVTAAQLRASLGVTPEQFATAQNARVMAVHHDEKGAIAAVQILDAPPSGTP